MVALDAAGDAYYLSDLVTPSKVRNGPLDVLFHSDHWLHLQASNEAGEAFWVNMRHVVSLTVSEA
jgi:hypothetical protein